MNEGSNVLKRKRGSDKGAMSEKIFKIAHDKYFSNSTPNPLPNILASIQPLS